MKLHAGLLLSGLILSGTAAGSNLTAENAAKTSEIIEAAVNAYGGERISELKTLIIENEDVTYAAGQSLGTTPPWDRNRNRGMAAIDLENNRFATHASGAGGGFEFDNATIINGEESYQIDYRAGTAAPIAQPDFDTASGPFVRVTPVLLVRQLQANSRTAHYLGSVEIDGREHDVVGFSMAVGPAISLYFDRGTGLLARSERVVPGIGLVEYRFIDQKPIDGIPFNSKFELYLNGDANLERQIRRTSLNASIDDRMTPDARLARIAAVEPDPLRRQEVADGVYLIGGTGTYAMFVDMGDHIVAVGGTAGIAQRIELLREVEPDKPIRYGVMTHHHFDHVLGVTAYADEGATVVAAKAHEEIVRGAAGDAVQLKLKSVGERKVLKGDARRVELIDIGPTAHAEHFLVAWLPEERVLFQADHFQVPATGPIPPAVEATRSFAEAIRRLELSPLKIVSAHSPRVATMDDLQAALDRQAVRLGAAL